MSTASVIIAAIFADNFLLTRLFGLESCFSSSEKRSSALEYGGLLTLVTVIAGTLSVLLNKLVFTALHIEYMVTFASALITLSVICACHLLSKRISGKMYMCYTKNMPIISTNCVVIAAARLCTENSFSMAVSVLYLLAAGVGYTLALIIFGAVQERIETSCSPLPAFRGLPILLLCAAIAAMAFSGFVGVGA